MKINATGQTFNGYKNLIFNNFDDDNGKFTFLAMELNDKDGHNDLTEFKKLQKMIPFNKEISEFENVLFLLYCRNLGLRKLILNDQNLLFGYELRHIGDKFGSDDYLLVEKFHLKAYQLLASITKRITQNELCEKNSGIGQVFLGAFRMMTEVTKKSQDSYNLILRSLNTKESLPKVGVFLNQEIQKNMQIFFK